MLGHRLSNIWGHCASALGLRGRLKPRPVQPIRSVLFVCRGNICRSAYAEKKFHLLLRDLGLSEVNVSSAGLETTPDKPADPVAIEVARSLGIDLSTHRTRRVDKALVAADLILAMEGWQIRVLRKRFAVRAYLLGAFGEGGITIFDPYALPPMRYSECFSQIDEALIGVLRMIGESNRGQAT